MKDVRVLRYCHAIGAVVAVLSVAGPAYAERTTGGINWLDPLGYQKPAFVSLTVPDEAAAPKYYVDLASGSGTSCTQAAPCALASVAGKPGTNGGPAYVYLKGTGRFYLFDPKTSFYGSAGKEIVVKPWPAGTTGCPSGCTATIKSSSVNTLEGSNLHHWIFDGGPNMGITIETSSAGDNNALRVNASNITLYRVQGRCDAATQRGNRVLAVSSGKSTGFKVINSEFYGCEGGDRDSQQSALYLGSSSCFDGNAGYDNFLWQNNIVRGMGGEGIEINPRSASTGATIVGSVFHDVGKQVCGGNWDCRPAITVDDCGGSASGITVSNNLMWDLGSSCMWTKGRGSSRTFDNNTCYDYSNGAGSGACQQGLCGDTAATVRNNIIYSPGGRDPFGGSSFTATNNLCGSGESCGTSRQTWSTSTLLSTAQNDPKFLMLGAASEAISSGINLFGIGVTSDYSGVTRSATGLFDLGAFSSGSRSVTTPPQAPSNVRIIK
jgi:hypothetical protein